MSDLERSPKPRVRLRNADFPFTSMSTNGWIGITAVSFLAKVVRIRDFEPYSDCKTGCIHGTIAKSIAPCLQSVRDTSRVPAVEAAKTLNPVPVAVVARVFKAQVEVADGNRESSVGVTAIVVRAVPAAGPSGPARASDGCVDEAEVAAPVGPAAGLDGVPEGQAAAAVNSIPL